MLTSCMHFLLNTLPFITFLDSVGSGYYELCHDADNAIMKTETVTEAL